MKRFWKSSGAVKLCEVPGCLVQGTIGMSGPAQQFVPALPAHNQGPYEESLGGAYLGAWPRSIDLVAASTHHIQAIIIRA